MEQFYTQALQDGDAANTLFGYQKAEMLRLRAEKDSLVFEANARIEKLNERIRELNQQLGQVPRQAAPPEKAPTGFFKR